MSFAGFVYTKVLHSIAQEAHSAEIVRMWFPAVLT
jgi:hypothetical protein